jgi:hypothetical protein
MSPTDYQTNWRNLIMTDERQVRTIRSVPPGNKPIHPIFPDVYIEKQGLSKLEHYAALFLAGMCANPAISLDVPPQDLARTAITQAGVLVAMLSEADRGDA